MVEVKVPATSANLGPGFDVVGLALNIYNSFAIEETESGLEIDILQDGGPRPSATENNLVFLAAKRLFGEVDFSFKGLKITIKNDVPMGRGLGSSSTAIVGGLMAANELSGANVPKERLFEMAAEIEGHPDNVGPAIFGGFTISYPVDASHRIVSYAPSENLKPLLLIPGTMLETKKARGVLPQDISMGDAVFTISRATLLVAALLEGNTGLLATAMQDRLHQPYRAPLIPGLLEIIQRVGRIPGVGIALSGAGPSLVCILDRSEEARILEEIKRALAGIESDQNYVIRQAEFDLQGARVTAKR
ncbi:MAG: homoserine kinase [Candidatus Aquicultor sp.]